MIVSNQKDFKLKTNIDYRLTITKALFLLEEHPSKHPNRIHYEFADRKLTIGDQIQPITELIPFEDTLIRIFQDMEEKKAVAIQVESAPCNR